MFKNYLKVAFRNIIKNRTYSIVNVIGLAIALICAIFIMIWVHYELSYDRYHAKVDQICLAYLKGTQEDNISYQSTTSPIIASILKNDFPEVINTGRVGWLGEVVFKHGDKKIVESRGIGADPELLDIFTFHFIRGNPATALADLNSMILTESLARKYFGEENPVGQVILMNNEFSFYVKAVIEDIPQNSHIQYDFIVPFDFLENLGYQITGTNFYPCNYYTYILLQKNIPYEPISEKVSQHIIGEGEIITFQITLFPLSEVYLRENGGKQKIYIFSLIAFVIIVIACINFMNLSVAQATKRAREVGIRKVVGATRLQIIRQIITESVIMAAIAIFMAVILVELFLPYFNNLINKQITITYFDTAWFIGFVGLVLFSGFLAGSYPAVFLSSFRPVKVLKASSTTWSNRSTFRKVLLVLQFTVSILFIITTLVMMRQIYYIRTFDLGINQENIFYVQLESEIQQRIPEVKNELLRNANIQFVTSSSRIPTVITVGSFRKWGREQEPSRRICEVFVDEDYLRTFDLKMSEGRFYSESHPTDATESIIVNRAAIELLGSGSYIDHQFYYVDQYKTLIGVMEDFQNISPLYSNPNPLVFHLRPNGNKYLFVKIHPNIKDIHTLTETTNYVRSVCDAFSPDFPLRYSFMNEFTYERERTIEIRQTIILYATIFAILISSLGLFGLSAFLNAQRSKEIVIRKVSGATIYHLLILLTKDFVKWIIFANLIAWPLAWYIMNLWLQNFAHKVTMPWWIFFISGCLALLVSFFAVGYQAIRAASANPVKALRYE